MTLGRKDTLSFQAVREITNGAEWSSFVELSVEEHFDRGERTSVSELPKGVDAKVLFRPLAKARTTIQKYLQKLTSEDLHKPELCADVFVHAFEKSVEELLNSDSERHYESTGELAFNFKRNSAEMNEFIRRMQRRDIQVIQSYLEGAAPFASITHIIVPCLKQHKYFQRSETMVYGLFGVGAEQEKQGDTDGKDPRRASEDARGKTDPLGILAPRKGRKVVKGETLVGGLATDDETKVDIPPASRVPYAQTDRKRVDTLPNIFIPPSDTSQFSFTPAQRSALSVETQQYVRVEADILLNHFNKYFSSAKAKEEAEARVSYAIVPPPTEGTKVEELTDDEWRVYNLGFEPDFYRLFRTHFRGYLRKNEGDFARALESLSTGDLSLELFLKLANHAMSKKVSEHERALEAGITEYLKKHTDTPKVKDIRQTYELMDPAAGLSAEALYFTIRELIVDEEEMSDQLLWCSYFFLEGNEQQARNFYRKLYNLVHAHFTYAKDVQTMAPPALLPADEETHVQEPTPAEIVEAAKKSTAGEMQEALEKYTDDDSVTHVRHAGIFDVPPPSEPKETPEEMIPSGSSAQVDDGGDQDLYEHSFRPDMLQDVVAYGKTNEHFKEEEAPTMPRAKVSEPEDERPTVPETPRPVFHEVPKSPKPPVPPAEKVIVNVSGKEVADSHATIRPHEKMRTPDLPRIPAPRPAAGSKPEIDLSRHEATEIKRRPSPVPQSEVPTQRPPKPKRWRRWMMIGAAAATALTAYVSTRKSDTVDDRAVSSVQTTAPMTPVAPSTTPKDRPVAPPKTVDAPVTPPKTVDPPKAVTPSYEFDNSRVPEANVYLRNLVDAKGFELKKDKGGVNRQFLSHAAQGFNNEQRTELKALNQKLDRGVYAVAMKKFGNLQPAELQRIAQDSTHADHGFLVNTLAISKQLNQPFSPKVKIMEKSADGTPVIGTDGKPVFKVMDYWEAYAEEYQYGQQYVEEMAKKGYANVHNIGKPGDSFNIENVAYYRDILSIAGAVKVASHNADPVPAAPGSPINGPAPANPAPQPQNSGSKHGFFQSPAFDHQEMTPYHKDKIEVHPGDSSTKPKSKYAQNQVRDINIPVQYADNKAPINTAGRAFTRTTDKSERLFNPGSSKNVNMSFIKTGAAEYAQQVEDPADLLRLSATYRLNGGMTFWQHIENQIEQCGQSDRVKDAARRCLAKWKARGVSDLPFSIVSSDTQGSTVSLHNKKFLEDMTYATAMAHGGYGKLVGKWFLKDGPNDPRKNLAAKPAVTPDRFAHIKAGAEAYSNNPLKIGGTITSMRPVLKVVEEQVVASRLRPDVEKFMLSGLKYYQKLQRPLSTNVRMNADGTCSKDVHPGLVSYLTHLMNLKLNQQPSIAERVAAAEAKKAAEKEAKFMAEAEMLTTSDLVEVNGVPKTWHIPRAEAMRPIDYIEKSLLDKLTRQAVNATNDRQQVAALVGKKQSVRAICTAMRNAYRKKFIPSAQPFVAFSLPERWHSKLADVLGANWGVPMKEDMVAQATAKRVPPMKPPSLPKSHLDSLSFLDDADVMELDEEAPVSGVRQRVAAFTSSTLDDVA